MWTCKSSTRMIDKGLFAFLILLLGSIVSCASTNVKPIHKDLRQLTLPPSAFSASSVYQNEPDYQAHKANLIVFASQEQFTGAWCPAQPIKNQRSEWLQIEFDALKIIRILFTEGGGPSQDAFVPSFFIRYQRDDIRWYDYRMRNGTKLLHANRNSQTMATKLDPPIVAKRFRIYPYTEYEPMSMCLRIAVYGSTFNDGVVEYAIPEGDIYRLDPKADIPLNDSSYDGFCLNQNTPSLEISVDSTESDSLDKRTYLYGGLGLLMDKQYYEGPLPEPINEHNVVGWFRRQQTTPSGRISMLFTFDRVRNFSRLHIHALNTLDYVALFRRILIQFSIGGQYFDRQTTPILNDLQRDTSDSKARWILIDLGFRTGQYVRITLWFDYDWIVLSEITFDSVPVTNGNAMIPEKATDSIHQIPEVDLAALEFDAIKLPIYQTSDSLSPVNALANVPVTTPKSVEPNINMNPVVARSTSLTASETSAHTDNNNNNSNNNKHNDNDLLRTKSSTLHYIIVIVFCCLGSFVFASLFVFTMFRLRRYRRRRLKKLAKNQLQHLDHYKPTHQHPLLCTTQTQEPNHFPTITITSSGLFTNSAYQYNPLKPNQNSIGPYTNFTGPDVSYANGISSNHHGMNPSFLDSQSMGGISLSRTYPDQPSFKGFPTVLDQEGLLALQLLQQSANHTTNLSSVNGLTLAHRGITDSNAFTPFPLVSLSNTTGLVGMPLVANPTTLPGTLSTAQPNGNRSFCPPPPPPPDQPLPPLPSSSSCSPEHGALQNRHQFSERNPGGFVIGTSISPVLPYAASFTSQAYQTENGFILPIGESPMPEYASASLFSGGGSGTLSLSHPISTSLSINPITSKLSTNGEINESIKQQNTTAETYCIPHHANHGIWNHTPHISLNSNTNSTLPNTNPCNVFTPISDGLSESLDSSGFYYLANPTDQNSKNMSLLSELNGPSNHTLFVPFATTSHLIPIQTVGLHPNLLVSSKQPNISQNQNCRTNSEKSGIPTNGTVLSANGPDKHT